jgi:DNA-directed RNA polymerase specialized sigma24 family protein
MIAARKLMQPEIRERMTTSILEALSRLPETEKNMFIWKHYCGWPVEKIAGTLKCNTAEVDRTLGTINTIISQRAGALLT